MTVNGRSVDGRLFPFVFSCSGVATPEDWRHGALSPTVRCRRRDGDVLGRAPRRSCSPCRRTRCDRAATSDWATGGQLPSLIRRRSPEADVVGESADWPTSRRLSRTGRRRYPSRAGRGRRDGTPVARTMSQVGSRADAAPGAHQAATAFRRRRPTSPSVSTCRGVFGIGWSASAAFGKAWQWRNVRSLRRRIFRL